MASTRTDPQLRSNESDYLRDPRVPVGPADVIDLRTGRAEVHRGDVRGGLESLPRFPTMAPLGVEHLETIRGFARAFEDYSDFSATSMWGWSATVPGGYRVGSLHDNLVVEFGDYLSRERFLSFLGDESPDETAAELLEYAAANGLDPTLRLVPEVTANLLDPQRWNVQQDLDAADYVYSVERTAALHGKRYRSMRHAVNSWEREWAPSSQLQWLPAETISQRRHEILDLFDEWQQRESAGACCSAQERTAISSLLERTSEVAPGLSAWSGLCVTEGRLSAVFLNERERDDRLAGHFFKMTDRACGDHLFTWYFVQLCRRAHAAGMSYVNIQQDLGIPGLRAAKQQLRPDHFLRKYDVSPRP